MKISISGRIILIAVVAVIASSIIILLISTIMMNRLLTRTIYDDMSSMQSVVENMITDEERQLEKTIDILVTLPQFVDAVADRDIEGIFENARSIRNQFEYDVVTVTDALGIVLARGHSNLSTDDISKRPMMAAALNGEVSSGVYYDATALVPFSIRSFSPIYKDGDFVGVLSIGTNVASEAFVDHMHRITNMDFSVFNNDIRYMTSYTDTTGNRITGTTHDNEQIVDRVLNKGETVIGRYELMNEMHIIAIWPIMDSDSNRIIGMWEISNSLTHQDRETSNVILIVILCSLVIILITILIANRYGKIIARPISNVTGYAIKVAGGDLDVSLDEMNLDTKSSNEVGLLIGALKTMVATLKDRIHEIELRRIEADTANQYKSSFLAKMSHEIRTPMNVILGLTEVLMRDEKIRKYAYEELTAIYSSGNLLLNIINDILDLSKIEAGKLELMPERYDIPSLINDTTVLNLMRIEGQKVKFSLLVDENIPSTMIGDEIRIKQVLNNIISNAFKYTEQGEVILSFTIGKDNDITKLIFSVSDTGYGMTQDEVSTIFDEYSRFNFDTNRAITGTGLGMSITKNLVKLMDGDIFIESEIGKGTVVTVSLPQIQTGSNALGSEVADKLRNFQATEFQKLIQSNMIFEPMPYGTVLIVDDVESNLFVARGLLSPYGLTIETVTSGYQAIEKIKEGNVYDIIFMDHMMPKMDGIEATEIIRDLGYPHPVVALTANAVAGQMEIFLKKGFDDFITKPIDARYMSVVLKKFIRDKQPPEVIETAHAQMKVSALQKPNESAQASVSSQLAELFIIDALSAIKTIEDVYRKAGFYNEEDMSLYSIAAHAMKTALLNVDETELSAFAGRLEQAGLDKNASVISDETPAFISLLRKLVARLTPPKISFITDNDADIDYMLLKEKLLDITGACGIFDKKTAKNSINELRRLYWPLEIRSLLSTMYEQLVSGDFDEVLSTSYRISALIPT